MRGLLTKGKNGMFHYCHVYHLFIYIFVNIVLLCIGTNDAFVTISLGKEKFQTSVKQKSPPDLEWQEECEL